MAGLWSRIKTWITDEEITAADLNAEFDNIKTNLNADTLDDISENIPAMQQVFDPGDVGTENQPTTLEEEIQSLRSMIKKVTGESVWYVPPGSSLSTLASSIGLVTPNNRLVSGHLDSDNQPMALQADNSTLDLKIEADPTNLVFAVEGSEYTKSSDDTITVATGPDITAAANQAQFADTVITDDANSKILGEDKPSIIYLDTVGATFASQKDKLCAFTTTHATDGVEYFLGILRQDTTSSEYYIEKCLRGFFYDSTLVGQRVRLDESANQVIAYLTLSYNFIKSDGTFITTINEPFVSSSTPTALAVNDMWFDTVNDLWKVWNGSIWADSGATFLGFSAQKQGACVAARIQHYYKAFDSMCNIAFEKQSYETNSTILQSTTIGAEININGTKVNYWSKVLQWNSATDMDTGSIAASSKYYLYLDDSFEPIISLIKPFDRQMDMKGFYHPWKPWRCIGHVTTDSSSYFNSPVCYGGSSHISDKSMFQNKMASFELVENGGEFARNIVATTEVNGVNNGDTNSVKFKSDGRPLYIALSGSGASGCSIVATGAATVTMQIRWRRNGNWTSWATVFVASINLTGTIPCNLAKIGSGVFGDAEVKAAVSANATVYGQLIVCEL